MNANFTLLSASKWSNKMCFYRWPPWMKINSFLFVCYCKFLRDGKLCVPDEEFDLHSQLNQHHGVTVYKYIKSSWAVPDFVWNTSCGFLFLFARRLRDIGCKVMQLV